MCTWSIGSNEISEGKYLHNNDKPLSLGITDISKSTIQNGLNKKKKTVTERLKMRTYLYSWQLW